MDTPKITILVAGPQGSGKTNIVRRIVEEKFSDEYTPTTYIDMISYTLATDDGKSVRIFFVDTAGKNIHEALSQNAFKTNCAAIVVYDVSDQRAFGTVKGICELVQSSLKNKCTILVGNKCDKDRVIDRDEIEEFAKELNISHMETSAKTNKNIKEMVTSILKRVLEYSYEKDSKIAKSSSVKRQKRNSVDSLDENDTSPAAEDRKLSSSGHQTAKTTETSSCCALS